MEDDLTRHYRLFFLPQFKFIINQDPIKSMSTTKPSAAVPSQKWDGLED